METPATRRLERQTSTRSTTSTARRRASLTSTSAGESTVHFPGAQKIKKPLDPVWIVRVLFVLCLMIVASILGFLAFRVLSSSERNLAEEQFLSIADRALVAAQRITQRKLLGSVSMASVVSNVFNNASQWPFVAFSGFEEVSTNIKASSDGQGLGFAPLVYPEDRVAFEDFAYNFFEEMNFPETTGISSFGRGIWGFNPNLGTPDKRYHATDPKTRWGSPYELFVPVFQTDNGPTNNVLMLNTHAEPTRGRAQDSILDCVAQREGNSTTNDCSAITDVLVLLGTDGASGAPSAIIYEPILPASDRTKATGIVLSVITWDQTLTGVFNDGISGIDIILRTDTVTHTYTVDEGQVVWLGEGDFHETKYNKFEQSIVLTQGIYFTNSSATYTLYMYPTEEFFDVYGTHNPTTAMIGAVLIIALTSAMFFVYDLFVRRDIKTKTHLLDAKRAFVRFVSHEVRTPLNSVIMGLTLMQEEMALALGYRSAEALSKDSNKRRGSAKVLENVEHGGELIKFFKLSEEIHENALRSVDVLNDLLNYDKIEIGNLKLELVVIPILQLVERTAAEFKGPASQKKIEFRVDLSGVDEELQSSSSMLELAVPRSGSECRTVGDDIRIAQVMRNLLSNAIKFTPDGGKIRVKASWSAPKAKDLAQQNVEYKFVLKRGEEVCTHRCGFLKVSVLDTGAGMTPEQVSTVFEDGVQFNANELQKGNGTGLGLHIAKGIVELHGGELYASSKGFGKGTCFTMKLPLHYIPDAEEMPTIVESTVDRSLSACYDSKSFRTKNATKPMRILVVDDAAMNRKLLSRLLRNRKHECDEADDGDVAVEMVRATLVDGVDCYDTILLDHEMPKLSGPDAAKAIRAMGSDVFIVGVTGNLLPDDVQHFKVCGANEVLPKPFKLASLEDLWLEHNLWG